MNSKSCFAQGFNCEAQYICSFYSPEAYSCENHRDHNFIPIFLEPFEGTKEAILCLLAKEKSKKEKLKRKILKSLSRNLQDSKINLEENLRKLDSDLLEICDWTEKIFQAQKISKLKGDPVLKLLILHPDDAIKSLKEMIPKPHKGIKLFCMLNEEIMGNLECYIENHFEAILNTRLINFENRLVSNDKIIDDKLTEMKHSISNIIQDNKRKFEDQTNKIEMRIEEQDKIIDGRFEEINQSISHIIDEREKMMRENIYEINIERRLEKYDKTIKEKLADIIDENEKNNRKFEEWKLGINIENRFEEQNKVINGKLSELADEIDKNFKKFQGLKQETCIETQNQVNRLSSQIISTLEDLNKKINENQLFTSQDWKIKKQANLSKVNDQETEREFRITCALYEKLCSIFNQSFSQDYHEYLNNYHHKTSLYLTKQDDNSIKLIIYDTENEREEEKILDTLKPLHWGTCIAQLPNGEIFCYGGNRHSDVALIIDRSHRVRILPSGTPCIWSSAIYFNNNIYCFGGSYKFNSLILSSKFDLSENRWINLIPMPQANALCHSIIFNGNILISGDSKRNLLLYSIDIDSFSTIPYKFAKDKRKILINMERLYLIECSDGYIYDSEDEYNWKQIGKSVIRKNPAQVYLSYNKGGIYIANSADPRYYKFDLAYKTMTILNK